MSCFKKLPLTNYHQATSAHHRNAPKPRKKVRKNRKNLTLLIYFSPSSPKKKLTKKLAKKFMAKKYKTPLLLDEEMQITRRSNPTFGVKQNDELKSH